MAHTHICCCTHLFVLTYLQHDGLSQRQHINLSLVRQIYVFFWTCHVNSSIKVQSKPDLSCLEHDTTDKWIWHHLLHDNVRTYHSLAWLSLHTALLLGVSVIGPGNDQALRSLISKCDDYSQAFNALPSKPRVNYVLWPEATETIL